MEALIVGAGPTGLTMACELAMHGIACRMIDERGERSRESRALGVQARTLEIFRQLDVVDEALARGHRIRGGILYAGGRSIADVELSGVESPYPFVLSLPQSDTEAILERRLREFGVEVERGVELTGLAVSAESALVSLGPKDEKSEARWVIGCDGARSAVRQFLGIPFSGGSFRESFMLADVQGTSELGREHGHFFLTAKGILVCIPLPDGSWRLVADFRHDESVGVQPTLDDVVEVVAERAPGAVRVESASWISPFRIHRRIVDTMRYGPCFLAGDAAHIHSPVGGQGMNTGIQDAHNLAWKLAYVARGIGRANVLDSYHRERHPIARRILWLTTAATRAATFRSPLLRGLRDFGARAVGRTSLLDAVLPSLVAETSLRYRRGPITDKTPIRLATRRPRAGDRLPDVAFAGDAREGRHLLDHLRPTHFTLLLFCKDVPKEAEPIVLRIKDAFPHVPLQILVVTGPPNSHPRSSEVVVDENWALHGGLDVREKSAILIRPDGYIAHRSEPMDSDALIHYLDSLFV